MLGGTLLSGGEVSVIGTLLGAVLVTMLTNGLLLLQVGEFWVQACLGLCCSPPCCSTRRAGPGWPAEDRLMDADRSLRTDWFGPLADRARRDRRDRHAPAVLPVAAQHPGSAAGDRVNMLIAFSQMIIIAIGQMNLAVGAIGGLAAICFAGMMQVWGLPAPLRRGRGAGDRPRGRHRQRLAHRAGPASRPSSSRWPDSRSSRASTSRITKAQPFYGVPESVKAFGNTTFLGPLPWLSSRRHRASR